MNIVFLDIDGVLITDRYIIHRRFNHRKDFNPNDFDPICVQKLKEILDKTNSKIVVSSSKREGRTVKELIEMFDKYGLGSYIIDRTPVMYRKRGDEIQEWLNTTGKSKYRVDKFIIIDDEKDMGKLMPYLILTSQKDGITAKTVDKSIKKLLSDKWIYNHKIGLKLMGLSNRVIAMYIKKYRNRLKRFRYELNK